MSTKDPRATILVRERVNTQLASTITVPINIISAPMGFGKTTAVQTFLNENTYPYIWVTMTEALKIAPSKYFWLLLVRELSKIDKKFADILQNLGFPEDSVQIIRIIDRLQDLSYQNDFFWIIDDFYLIENAEIDFFLERLAFAQIPWLHILIITRHLPALPITEFTMKGICSIISSQDLSFTEQEIQEYLALIDMHVGKQVLEQIYSYSNGWITAIYVMVTSYLHNGYLDLDHSVHAMLETAFYSGYDEQIKTTMLKLSVFESFSVAQAKYVLEDQNLPFVLDFLCQQNAFISHNISGIYKFHQIFHDFLNEECQKSDIDLQRIICRAGNWYSQHGDHAQAFKFWLMAKDYEHIFEELECSNISNISSINQKLLSQIFNYTDQTLRYKYPLSTLKYIFFYVLHVDKQMGIRLLKEAMEYFETHSLPDYSCERILAEGYIIYTSIAFNDYNQIIKHSQKALELLNGKTSLIRTPHSVLTYGLPHFTYAYYHTPGDFWNMTRTLLDGFGAHVKATGGCGAGFEYISRAEYALETGDYENVETNAKKAIYKADLYDQTCIIVCAQMTLGRLYLFQNRIDEYQKIVSQLLLSAKTEQNTLNLNCIDNALGYLAACNGDIRLIPSWLKTGNMTSCTTNYHGSAFNYIIYGKAVYLSGNYVKLEILTESFNDYFSYFNNQLGFIHNHIHNALAKYHLYGSNIGVKELDKALIIGEKDHIIMPFIENGAYLLPMLTSGLSRVSSEYIETIVNYIKNNDTVGLNDITSSHKGFCQLSERETEILDFLSHGMSRKIIADKLYISENTVKRHIQNIYQKLDVNNKTLAIKKFSEMQKDISNKNK